MCSSVDWLDATPPPSSSPQHLALANGNAVELEATCTPDASSSSRILQRITEFRERSLTTSPQTVKHQRWQVLLFGQTIAIAAASVNASSYTLQYNLGVVLPLFQVAIMYIILSSYLACRPGADMQTQQQERFYTVPLLKIKLRIPWWIYFLMSVIDVEANYMVLLSLRFTSLTSTTLLGSLTVPSVLICSRYLLARVFFCHHYIGVCLCLLGGTIMVWSDLGGSPSSTNATDTMHPSEESYIGDLLAMSAALLYGLGDTLAEYAIKHVDRAEYLGMIGLFGFLISSIQCCWLEWDALVDLLFHTPPTHQGHVVATMVWYVFSLVFYYVAASYFLTRSDATLLNLSLQTTSLWSCTFSVILYGKVPPLLFFVAAMLVTSGVCVYEVGGNTFSDCNEEDATSSDDDESVKLTYTSSGHDNGKHHSYMSIDIEN